jgi:hypothetical protein
LADIEDRLYDLSFDPNHPPELRWGAPEGSEERAGIPDRETPVPDGTRIAMAQAYEWQFYYRTIGQREIEPSILRGMFTEGFPIRDKFEGQLAKWLSGPVDRQPTHEASAEAEGGEVNAVDRARSHFLTGAIDNGS